uniref:Uncharacterized protein n=1 Tax=Ditylum brightwellii TaxID=49249 RepID=A0A7S4WE76_9STRA|mmetsp:Transcript_28169/g.37471  ORF Transcript_28169/g.37471 Transcript_28169/m.37471 type:complete len:419 (+) Transcript_28169:260-1516(+)
MTYYWVPETTNTMERASPSLPVLNSFHQSYYSCNIQSFRSTNVASGVDGVRHPSQAIHDRCPNGNSHQNMDLAQHHQATSSQSDDNVSLKREREKDGRCADCGIQTHKVVFHGVESSSEVRTTKEPLTIEKEVHRGRCLLCHPIPTTTSLHQSTTPCASVGTTANDGDSSVQSRSMPNTIFPDKVESFHRDQTHEIPIAFSSPLSITQRRPHPDGEKSNVTAKEALDRTNFDRIDICDIISIMRSSPSNPTIQERGCKQLWIQSWDDETSCAIGRVGGISSVVDAMLCHMENTQLQQYACEALQNLAACNNYNRDVIVDQGGITAITDAMHVHQYAIGVQISGCAALANIAMGSTDNKIDVAECGGIYAVVKAFESFPEEAKIILAARQVLTVLGYNPTSQYVHLESDEMEDDFDMED